MLPLEQHTTTAHAMTQLYVTGVGPHTLCLPLTQPSLSTLQLKQLLTAHSAVPAHLQRLSQHGHILCDSALIDCSETAFITFSLSGLVGGKGGFGSNLRAATTKVGAKKTSNFTVSVVVQSNVLCGANGCAAVGGCWCRLLLAVHNCALPCYCMSTGSSHICCLCCALF